jgi:hypothetical protein
MKSLHSKLRENPSIGSKGINMESTYTPRYDTVARMWRLYKTGIGLTTGFIGLLISYTQFIVHTLYNSQQLSLFSSSEDFGSNSATTATTNSYGIPCHHSLHWQLFSSLQLTSYIAWEQTTKKTRPPHCCLGIDHKENASRFHCCVVVHCCVFIRCHSNGWKHMPYCLQRACHNTMSLCFVTTMKFGYKQNLQL